MTRRITGGRSIQKKGWRRNEAGGLRVTVPAERGSPLRETSVLTEILHPVLRALRLPQACMHAFRHGCTRWELSGMNPAVLRQQMGHRSATMTARYRGEIPLDQVQVALSKGKLEIWKMAALYVQSLSRV